MMDKPLYRVAAAGLDPRDARLIEIVFRHSQYNRYAFRFVPADSFESIDILIVNTVEAEGLRALARMRTLGREVPVVAAVPRGAPSSARHAISIDRLTLQLLPILNRVVELELAGPATRPMTSEAADSPPGPAAPMPAPGAQAQVPTARSTVLVSAPGGVSVAASAAPPTLVGARVAAPAPQRAAGVAPAATLRPSATAPGSAPTAPQGAQLRAQASAMPQPTRAPQSRRGTTRFPSPPTELPRRRPEMPASAPAAPVVQAGTRVAAAPARTNPAHEGTAGLPPVGLRADAPRVRVLVVDDSPTVRRQLVLAFERMGVACDAVPSAAAGLARMADVRYDLVLVDVVMPEIDGYQLTREIRRRHRGIPVIILTSRSSPFDLARGALSGCSSYLVKPVTLRRLEAAVIKVLRKTLAIDDLTGLLRPISLYAPASSRPSEPE
jgi:CheY-like chemotaxis protein